MANRTTYRFTMRSVIFILLSFQIHAQIGTGQWRLHVPAKKAIDIVSGNKLLYAAFEGGLMEYDNDANETSVLHAINGLSDINLTCLAFDDAKNALYIGYANGNIDKIQNNRIINIPAIKLAQIQGSKRINKIVKDGDFMYFATAFSIVKIDPIKEEVKDTWYPTNGNSAILDVAFIGDSVYALTNSRLFRAKKSSFSLANPAEWQVDTRLPILTNHAYTEIETIDQQLFVQFNHSDYGKDSVFQITENGTIVVTESPFSLEIVSIRKQGTRLNVNLIDGVYVYNQDLELTFVANTYGPGKTPEVNNSHWYDNYLWIADNKRGLVRFRDENSALEIPFSGPPKNSFYEMDAEAGKIAIAGGGLSAFSSTYNSAGAYTYENEKWTLYDKETVPEWSDAAIWDVLSVGINPKNTAEIAFGSYSEIPVSTMNTKTKETQKYTPNNSTLEFTSSGIWSFVSNVRYDIKGNLWVLNGFADKPLKVKTKDDQWYEFDCGTNAKNKLSQKLVIDYNGNKWFTLRDGGLYGYNDNNTIDNSADDKLIQLTVGANSGALPSNTVNAIAVDFDNEIWIGTDNGFAVLYNSKNAFEGIPGQYNAQRIKINFEGEVEYVLGKANITDIEVDGGNRKWFGTANSGILLLSPDGQTILQQFTTDNSPLISNVIYDIKLDHTTGELFIITDKGLVSYRTDATYEDPEYSEVTVFPNPAYPDFAGDITIQGIRYNSDVKITDIAGNLVYQTTSNGGTATWNKKTSTGEKVTTGVYLIWTAANEGKGRKVGKVLVIH